MVELSADRKHRWRSITFPTRSPPSLTVLRSTTLRPRKWPARRSWYQRRPILPSRLPPSPVTRRIGALRVLPLAARRNQPRLQPRRHHRRHLRLKLPGSGQIRLVMRRASSMSTRGTRVTLEVRPIPSARSYQMPGGSMICRGTFGNGVPTVMTRTTIHPHTLMIHRAFLSPRAGFPGAVAGASSRGTAARQTASVLGRRTGSTSSGSA
jgi:hypothetical protein